MLLIWRQKSFVTHFLCSLRYIQWFLFSVLDDNQLLMSAQVVSIAAVACFYLWGFWFGLVFVQDPTYTFAMHLLGLFGFVPCFMLQIAHCITTATRMGQVWLVMAAVLAGMTAFGWLFFGVLVSHDISTKYNQQEHWDSPDHMYIASFRVLCFILAFLWVIIELLVFRFVFKKLRANYDGNEEVEDEDCLMEKMNVNLSHDNKITRGRSRERTTPYYRLEDASSSG